MESGSFIILSMLSFALVFYAVHELSSRSRAMSYLLFVAFPLGMLPLMATTEWNGWFNIIKSSTMIFVGAFVTLVRFNFRHHILIALVALLLPLNIAEAALKDFENGRVVDVLCAGLVILLLPRLSFAKVSEGRERAVTYPTSWPALIAYSVWHMGFMYRYVSGRGCPGDYVLLNVVLLLIPMVVALSKGSSHWLQARAYTLAFSIILVESTVRRQPGIWPLTEGTLYGARVDQAFSLVALGVSLVCAAILFRSNRSSYRETFLGIFLRRSSEKLDPAHR